MNPLTLSNLEETFSNVCKAIGNQLQSTSTYLMRAESVEAAVEELGITMHEFLERIDKPDYDRLIDYGGPIIWADYDKESFNILLHTDNESLQTFCDKVLAK